MLAAVGAEPRTEDRTVPSEESVARELLDEDFERVAGLQVALEIDLAPEDVRKGHRQLNRLTRRFHRGDERRVSRVDDAMDRDDRPVLLVRVHGRVQDVRPRGIGHDDSKEAVGVDLVLELLEETVERAHEPIGLVLTQLTQVEDRSGRSHGGLDEIRWQIVRLEQAVECRVRRHDRLEDLRLLGQDYVVRMPGRCWSGRLTGARGCECQRNQSTDR